MPRECSHQTQAHSQAGIAPRPHSAPPGRSANPPGMPQAGAPQAAYAERTVPSRPVHPRERSFLRTREGGRSLCRKTQANPLDEDKQHPLPEGSPGGRGPSSADVGTRLQSLLLHLVPGGARAPCAPWQVGEQAMGTAWRRCWLREAAPPIFSSPWVFLRLLGPKRTPSPQSWSSQRKKLYSPGPHATGTIALPTSRVLLCPSVCHRTEGAIAQWDQVS